MSEADPAAALREEVAACTRMLVDLGIMGYSGHVSARLPGGDGLLVQPVADVRATLSPERLLVVDLDGAVLDGEGHPPSEVHIHTEIYRARPDVGAVVHFHHDPTTIFTLVEGVELVAVKNHASRWVGGIPLHRDVSHISTRRQGAEVAATLGQANALLLRAHGEVVVAEDVACLFADTIHFVENADTVARAAVLGKVVPLTEEEATAFLATFRRGSHARKVWKYHAALARRNPLTHSGALD